MKRIFILFMSVFFILYACNNSGTSNTDDLIDLDAASDSLELDDLESTIEVVPTPLEAITFMEQAGLGYRGSLLNPSQNKDKYATISKKSVNLGIYSVDLTYSAYFQQTQTGLELLNTNRYLVEKLNLAGNVDFSVMDKFEKYMANRDSVVNILSDMFMNTNSHLLYGNNPEIGTMSIVGVWTEAMYLMTQLYKDAPNNKMLEERIIDQRYALETVLNLLKRYDNHPDIVKLIGDMQRAEIIFAKIEIEEKSVAVVADSLTNTVTIKTVRSLKYDATIIDELTKLIEELRTKYIA